MKINKLIKVRNLHVVFILFLFFSCDDDSLNKSIFEPIEPHQLSEIFKKDSTFKSTYQFLEASTKLFLNSNSKKAEYLELTYNDFHDFFQIVSKSSKKRKELNEKFINEWMDIVKGYKPKIDSLSNYWKEQEKNLEYVIVPDYVRKYWEVESNSDSDPYKHDIMYSIIDDHFDSEIVDYYTYMEGKFQEEMEKKNKLAYNYFLEVEEIFIR